MSKDAAIEIQLTLEEAKALSWVTSTAISEIEADREVGKHEKAVRNAAQKAKQAVGKLFAAIVEKDPSFM